MGTGVFRDRPWIQPPFQSPSLGFLTATLTPDASVEGVTIPTFPSSIGGGATGDASTTAATVVSTASIIPGEAVGGGVSEAFGVRISAAGSVIGGAASADANTAGTTLSTSANAIPGVSSATIAAPVIRMVELPLVNDGEGAPVVLRLLEDPVESQPGAPRFSVGANLAGLEFGTSAPPTLSEHAYLADRLIRRSRLTDLWERLQPTKGAALDAAQVALVNTQIGYADTVGNEIVLELMHNGGGRPEGKIGAGGSAPTIAHFVDAWVRFDAAFGSSSAVRGYDLMNEWNTMPDAVPVAMPSGDIVSSSQIVFDANQAAIIALRAAGCTKWLYIEGNHWSSSWCWAYANPLAHTYVDPLNKLIHTAHVYADRDNSGTHFDYAAEVAAVGSAPTGTSVSPTILADRTAPFVAWLAAHSLEGNIGEFGVPGDSQWLTVLDNGLAYFQAHNLENTYWAVGQAWGAYPFNAYTTGGVQAKQMAVLNKYTGAPDPITYTLTGPLRGSNGSPSSAFTVEYRGYLATSKTVTLSDNGAGGAFTSSPVTLAAGFNPSATFTYTAAIEGVVSISATNNAGFTDPTPLNYYTTPDSFFGLAGPPICIYGLRPLYTGYTGPIVSIQRVSDGAWADYSFNVDGQLPRQAMADWAGTAKPRLGTVYNQYAGATNHLSFANLTRASLPGDYPVLTLDNSDDFPEITWASGRKMEFLCPDNGHTAQTQIFRAKYTGGTFFGNQDIFTGPWRNNVASVAFTIGGVTKTVSTGAVAGTWADFASTYLASTTNGIKTYKAGVLQNQSNSDGAFVTQFNLAQSQMGYFRFSEPVTWAGSWQEYCIINATLSLAQVGDFHTRAAAFYSTPYPAFTPPGVAPAETSLTPVAVAAALPHHFKGVNLASGESNPGPKARPYGFDYLYPSHADFDYWFSKGLKTIRLPFDPYNLQPVNFGAFVTAEKNRITDLIEYARLRGMYVILDPHSFGSFWNSTAEAFQSVSLLEDEYEDFMVRVATVWKNYPNVIFEMMNEPNNAGTSAYWFGLMTTRIVLAMRAVVPTRWFILNSGGFSGAHDYVSRGDDVRFAAYTDPVGGPWMVGLHQYPDSDNSGTHAACAVNGGDDRLIAATTALRTAGLTAHLGEFAWSQDASCNTEGPSYCTYMSANDDVWLGSAFWTGGPFYGDFYHYNINPTSGVDKPQLAALIADLSDTF